MVCSHDILRSHRHHHLAISFFILVISTSSHFRFLFTAEGRKLAQTTAESPKTAEMKEDKTGLWRSHIGSRPPRCDRRCGSCTRCEAIQVPTNPQTTTTTAGVQHSSPLSAAAVRGDDDDSNYKPLSWKCKCGNFIYNP